MHVDIKNVSNQIVSTFNILWVFCVSNWNKFAYNRLDSDFQAAIAATAPLRKNSLSVQELKRSCPNSSIMRSCKANWKLLLALNSGDRLFILKTHKCFLATAFWAVPTVGFFVDLSVIAFLVIMRGRFETEKRQENGFKKWANGHEEKEERLISKQRKVSACKSFTETTKMTNCSL